MDRNDSWPAVSQICSLICLPGRGLMVSVTLFALVRSTTNRSLAPVWAHRPLHPKQSPRAEKRAARSTQRRRVCPHSVCQCLSIARLFPPPLPSPTHHARAELDADCEVMHGLEAAVGELQEQARLAHARIADWRGSVSTGATSHIARDRLVLTDDILEEIRKRHWRKKEICPGLGRGKPCCKIAGIGQSGCDRSLVCGNCVQNAVVEMAVALFTK